MSMSKIDIYSAVKYYFNIIFIILSMLISDRITILREPAFAHLKRERVVGGHLQGDHLIRHVLLCPHARTSATHPER